MRIILFFLATFLFANEKLLIAQFENLKPYYYNHQIVNLKLKIITAKDGNLTIIDDNNKTYEYQKINQDYVSNIYFELNNTFPKFKVSLVDNNISDEVNLTIDSKIKNLYPPKDFCHVIAKKLIITDKILTNYDKDNNIVYWSVIAIGGDAKNFKIGLKDEKLYFLDKNNTASSYSYSALVPIDKNDFKFSYFNLDKEQYEQLHFNIELKNDNISTQIDIKPMDKNRIYIITSILVVLLILWSLLYFFKRKIIYIILIIMTIASIIFFNLPKKEIILPTNTKIHILPFDNSTVFLVTTIDTKVKVLKTKNGWKKIEFNKNIGWVKDE